MRLRTLRLHGFKSFADRTQLEFRDGISVIIGSNGCGKSNLADAVRWVLGEQRASAIRGAKMDEVIFQGTVKRRPLNFAEVALLFSNEAGRVAVPQSEIEIARKTFREGGSEYSLNRTACRLRDIHGLLRDTGIGANSYSIIEAVMIDTLLSDRAEERRSLFEEAAGIGRYKDSRRATTRRLEAAEVDLARLGDLVAEVESKVRSLARQRRRAQRLNELRNRRLALEVALAQADLVELERGLAAMAERAAGLAREGDALRSERAARELLSTRCRSRRAELVEHRTALAARLDQIRSRLHAREREAVVAEERRSNAELRITQLVRERGEQAHRGAAMQADAERFAAASEAAGGALDQARQRLAACARASAALRAALGAERERAAAAAERLRQHARDRAGLQGEASAQRSRHQDAAQQVDRLKIQAAALAAELSEHTSQADLWAEQTVELRHRLDAATAAGEAARHEIVLLRTRESAARDALRAADDLVSRLTAQVDAREALESSHEGFAPAVAALRARPEQFPGVHGPLADFVDTAGAHPGAAAAAEAFLGPLLHALVVADLATARRIRDWFRTEWSGGGSLWLLPLDAPALAAQPAGARGRPALPGQAAGRRWVEALLADLLVLADEDPLATSAGGANRATPAGDVLDARGLVRLVERAPGEGVLVRRERLAALRAERDDAQVARDAARARLEDSRDALTDAEDRAREAAELRRAAAAELQRVEGEAAAQARRREAVERERLELVRLAEQQAAAAQAAESLASQLAGRLAELDAQLAPAEAEAGAARESLATLETRSDAVRDDETEHRVAVARAEAELREADRRQTAAATAAAAAADRTRAIDAEAGELRLTLDAVADVSERAAAEMRELAELRDAEAAVLEGLDAQVAETEREGADADAQAERLRLRESDHAEERHRLELQTADTRSRTERLRERLEAEWAMSWDALVASAGPPPAGDAAAWRPELRRVVDEVDGMGPVNLLAIEEHAEESRRLEFLETQQADLVAARDDLAAAIRQINRTAREVFVSTFATIRENFQRTFHSLFQGGECDVWLADEGDPLESPIEIQASPLGKKTQRIHLLSGGERTLTALALLFAIYLVKPSPFCVLDEVDAPLDESNVGRFVRLLQDFKADTQFIVITHNTRTMEAADWVYGVTMEEPGVSSIVSVELDGVWTGADRVA